MNETTCFLVDRYALQLHPASYLVEVFHARSDLTNSISPAELPSWVFRSKYVIWLSMRGDSVYERAKEGEKIRHELAGRLEQVA